METQTTTSISMEDLFNQYAKATLVEEANRFRTVKRGAYSIQVTKYEPKLTRETQRPYVHFTASVLTAEGKKQSTVFFNASWIEGRRADGKLDGMSKLWGNIEKAFNVVGQSIGEVLTATTQYPVRAYLDTVYRDQAGGNHYLKNNGINEADQEKEYLQAGYEPANTVLNISALK